MLIEGMWGLGVMVVLMQINASGKKTPLVILIHRQNQILRLLIVT